MFRIAVAVVLLALAAADARANEIWVAPSYQQDVGGLGIGSNVIWPVTPAGVVRLAFAVPNDLQSFQSARVALIPGAPGGTSNLSVYVCRAKHADLVAAACTGPIALPFTGVPNQMTEIDISAAIAPHVGAAGVNHLAVVAWTNPTIATDHFVGEEVAEVFPELVVRGDEGRPETVQYHTLNVLLLNELQKLARQGRAPQERIDALEREVIRMRRDR
jgi:hypothetical protein